MSDLAHEPDASKDSLSEARFRAAVAAVGVMWTNDAAGRMQGAQPGWGELTGQTQAEYQDYGWAAAVHPEDAQPTIDAWNEAVARRQTFEFEHRVRRHDGEWRVFSIRAVPVLDGGEIREWVGVHIDITERMRAIEDSAYSERRSRTILESITDGFFTLDPEWRFDYVNPEAERILGCEPGALLNKVIWDAYPGAIGTAFEQTYRRVAEHQRPETFLAFYPDHGRWYDVRAFPFAAGVSVYFRDVTDARHAEELQRLTESRFRTLFDSIDEGFCVIEVMFNEDGNAYDWVFLEANPAFARHNGLHDAVGKTILELAPDIETLFLDVYGSVVKTGAPIRFETESKVLQRWFDIYAFRLGEAIDRKVAVLFTNISARRLAEEELRSVAAELSEADRRKDEFLATLAHELRNPLAPIRNGLELIKMSNYATATVTKSTGMMERQLKQMVRLVDDLLDVSRISRDKLQLQKAWVTLSAVLSQAVETSRPLVLASGHELIVTAPPEPIALDADETRLVQVFSNLINNAAKFSDRGSKIWLTAVASSDSQVTISVRDQGVGIPESMLPRIFDMFTQVDQSLERSQGGLGIGLTLVKKLVELHGGSVEAKSAGDGAGSEFVVRLPCAPTHLGSIDIHSGDGASSSSQFKVLVADDNEDAAESLVEMLRMTGNTVRLAGDGQEAVDMAAVFQPQVIVLDIGMPKLNGYEACRRIREEPWGKSATLVALTGWGQDEDKRRSKEAGFDLHLIKPLDLAVLERLLVSLQQEISRSNPAD